MTHEDPAGADHRMLLLEAAGAVAQVTDDGKGFDPDTTLVRAAREGHLGLVGMHERMRMLGGRTHIESRPGGPTTIISVRLPRWSPQAEDDESPGEP